MLNNVVGALTESKKLEQSIEICDKIISDLNAILDDLPSVWEGVSANAFANNNKNLIEALSRIRKELMLVSGDIKKAASQQPVL